MYLSIFRKLCKMAVEAFGEVLRYEKVPLTYCGLLKKPIANLSAF